MQDQIARLRKTVEQTELGGGASAVESQHAKGKLCARERIEALVDPGSFVEIDRFVTTRFHDFGMDRKRFPGDGVVCGGARIDDRPVWVAAEDFTVIGGSLGEMHANKIARTLELATETGRPFIQINDSGGARIQEGVASLNGYGRIFRANVAASGVIPQLSLILGPCAGGAAYSPALTDFVFMVDGISHVFITGPQVIREVTGEEVSFADLGGPAVHAEKSGVCHFGCATETDCFARVREVLSFLPAHGGESAPQTDPAEPPTHARPLAEIIPSDPRSSYDVREVITALADEGGFCEVHARFARSAVVGFARLGGRAVGIVANQPAHLAGVLDIDASDKIARFVRTCDAFNLPVVNLVDVPGFLPGVDQEHGGIIRHGAKVLYAFAEATVPKLSVVLRKAYGGAYIGLCSRDLGFDRILALPSAEIAVMGPEGAVSILYRREIAAADDPERVREEHIRAFKRRFAAPYAAASLGLVDNVVEPDHLRRELVASIAYLAGPGEPGRRRRRHGNLPL